jgi:hypothetical protein
MKKHTKHRPHPHHLHAFRAILFGVLLVAVAFVRLNDGRLPQVTTSSSKNVLSYATSMSRAALLSENNISRGDNGLGPLNLNSKLNNSAQAKAQHMADNNYWAHVAPDGTQPWYFFEAAGYDYLAAGENLAYGFDSSFAVNQGWMNSPGHRANIVGDYSDVGFGFVDAPNFQGGEYTIVVAHYGKPLNTPAPEPEPTPAPAPSAPSSAPSSTTPTPPSTESSQAAEPTPTPAQPTEVTLQPATATPTTGTDIPVVVNVAEAKNVSVLDMFKMGTLPSVAIFSIGLTLVAALGYALTHRALMKHALATSEHFVISHPTFDVIALTLALALILSTTAARLQ